MNKTILAKEKPCILNKVCRVLIQCIAKKYCSFNTRKETGIFLLFLCCLRHQTWQSAVISQPLYYA